MTPRAALLCDVAGVLIGVTVAMAFVAGVEVGVARRRRPPTPLIGPGGTVPAWLLELIEAPRPARTAGRWTA